MSQPSQDKPGDSYPQTLDMPPAAPSAGAMRPRPTELPGTLPASLGSYELGEVLGKGGMGVVYKAKDRNLERMAAVKVLAPEMRVYPEALERLRAEARAAARLNHPGIVAVYALGDDADWTWIAMEFVEGENLARLVKLGGALPPAKATKYIRQAAEALEFAARQRIVHRDIKPANIMVTYNDDARVMDFGLAKQLDSDVRLTNTGATPGTPEYMSPEQALARDVDHRTDIYSLGCTYYTLLAGRAPFAGSSATEVIMKHVSQKIEIPREWRSVAGGKLTSLLEKMTAKEPQDRVQSWQEVVERLREIETALGGKPKEASGILTPPTPLTRPFVVSPSPKRGLIIGVVSVLGLCVVGGIVYAVWPEPELPTIVPLTNARSGEPSRATETGTEPTKITPVGTPALELATPVAASPTPFPTPPPGEFPPPEPPAGPGSNTPSAVATRQALTEGRWGDAAQLIMQLHGRDFDGIGLPAERAQVELNEAFAAARLAEAGLLAGANPPPTTTKEKGDAAVAKILSTASTMTFNEKWAGVLYLTFLGRPEGIEYAESLAKNTQLGPTTGRPLNMLYVVGAFMNPNDTQRWERVRPVIMRPGAGGPPMRQGQRQP